MTLDLKNLGVILFFVSSLPKKMSGFSTTLLDRVISSLLPGSFKKLYFSNLFSASLQTTRVYQNTKKLNH